MSIYSWDFGLYDKLQTTNWLITQQKQTEPYNMQIIWVLFI